MKVKKSDGTEIEIKLKRRHTKKIMKQYANLSSDGEDIGEGINEYQDTVESIALETTGMTQDEFDDLDAEDSNVILNKIQEVTLGQLDFLKSSLK